jgi:hypothetical protein
VSHLYGNSGSALYPFATAAAGTGGLYGAGRFTYSTNQFSESIAPANLTGSFATWSDLNFDSTYSASVTPTPTATGTILKVVMQWCFYRLTWI